MAVCSNCNGRISCGCQRRTASNGTQCCSTCIKGYEQSLISKQLNPNTPVTEKTVVWNKNRYTNK